jgi:hypothetical protein
LVLPTNIRLGCKGLPGANTLGYNEQFRPIFKTFGLGPVSYECRKTTVLRSHRCLNNTGVEKINYI